MFIVMNGRLAVIGRDMTVKDYEFALGVRQLHMNWLKERK